MGNWRNRPQRRFYRKERPPKSPPTSLYDAEPPTSSGLCQDGVPSWEKKFCYSIGSIPWWKVVDAKKYMYCHGNILSWDDSAGKEAFQNAKDRFWAKINGLPCDISLPDPDIYIDEINWSPDIDPELIKDLEREYFAPEEEGKDVKVRRKYKKTRNVASVTSEGCDKKSVNIDNPWECNDYMQGRGALKVKGQGWTQWNDNTNDLKKLNNGDDRKNTFTQSNEAVKNSRWGECGDKVWGWNHGGSHSNQSRDWDNGDNPWKRSCQDVGAVKDKGWGNFGDNSWVWNQQESRKLDNVNNPWEHSFIQDSETPKDRGWRDSGGNARGWKQWDTYYKDPKTFDFRRTSGNWRSRNESYWRENSHQYVSGYRNSRFQGDDYQTGHYWKRGNAKKRVSFALE